ncbi:hypothetical protein E2C01_054289 [Portunus trituberculatus]|uniref:Uncharacterized protein n=1 Tax=Portunus trituberculatus TaxID=210409 RepID=A0A5B7GRL1_PORTR|nr:hypothetical protein [Portunus trituberculatus]
MNKEEENTPSSPSKGKIPAVSFGTAAFILIRVKRAFKKKRAKLKSPSHTMSFVVRAPRGALDVAPA